MEIKNLILEELRQSGNVDNIADKVAKALNTAIKEYDAEQKETSMEVAYKECLKDFAMAWNRAIILYIGMYYNDDEEVDTESFLITPEGAENMLCTAITSKIVLKKVLRALNEAEHLEIWQIR